MPAPYYADEWLDIREGDCRAVLQTLPPESVHCVVTSPPYWGLRSYSTTSQEWGGDPAHAHEWGDPVSVRETTYGGKTRWQHVENGRGELQESRQDREGWLRSRIEQGNYCVCGAWRGDLGLEPTPDQYVQNLVDVFREVRRVLRSDGTVWLNLGDSYSSHDPGDRRDGEFLNPNGVQYDKGRKSGPAPRNRAGNYRPGGLKPKDLVGIPWRVAFALQADGWYLRSDIIWSKSNPMPESVTDRPTKSHEYLFLLSKSARYYWDAAAVAEPATFAGPNGAQHSPYGQGFTRRSDKQAEIGATRIKGGDRWSGFNDRWDAGDPEQQLSRNIRSVWTIATAPYPGAHFATFPPKLVEPCIKAGTSERGVCPECGAPWERVVDVEGDTPRDKARVRGLAAYAAGQPTNPQGLDYAGGHGDNLRARATTGWRPTCLHTACPVCDNVLTQDADHPVPPVRQADHAFAESDWQDADVLVGVREEGPRSTVAGTAHLLGMWEAIPAEQENGRLLHADVREPGDGADPCDDEGLRGDLSGLHPLVPAGTPDGDDDGLRGRTPFGDGRAVGPAADSGGYRRPHQRDQERQSAGESAGDDEAGPRRDIEPWPGEDGDVPGLREPLPAPRSCGQCGGSLRPLAPVPATCLDIFAGTGTVGLVAQSLSRRAVLIDLNAEYLRQCLARNAQKPLGLTEVSA